jgi:Protein of unknown function (DUF2846)
MRSRWPLFFAVLLTGTGGLIGCSSSQTQPTTPPSVSPSSALPTTGPTVPTGIATVADDPDAATVSIYRPKAFGGFALHPTVMLDGQDLVNIANGTVWSGKFKPGHRKFQMDDKQSGAEIDLKAGESYYFRVEIVPGLWKGGGRMTMMAKEQGSLDVQNLAPLSKNEVVHPAFK